MKAIDLYQFQFSLVGTGRYMVTYTTPIRGDYYKAFITDMTLIDDTKNEEYPKRCDIERLRTVVIRQGVHYRKNGEKID